MSIERVLHDMVGYENGQMHFEGELRALNRILDQIHEGVGVTIGSYRGQADCAIALHAHIPIFTVDPRQGWPGESRQFGDKDRVYWAQNVMSLGLMNKLRPVELPSLVVAKIWDKPISFLWIDGNHQEIAADLEAWLPHVVSGGIVGVHDNNLPSILAAVTARDDMVEFERADLSTFYRKEALYEEFTYDGLTMLVRKGPYSKDDRYVLGEVRSYSLPKGPLATILDIGSHIGAFSCWQASLHPEADIVAIEPETSGYKVLAKNAAVYPSITAINARINYDEEERQLFVDPVNSGSHRVLGLGEAQPGQPVVNAPVALTIEDIMSVRSWDSISLLKVDCESCEEDVLINCPESTLRKVKWIAGEFHHGYDFFMGTIGARLQALGFSVVGTPDDGVSHSTFVAINQNWVVPAEAVQVDIPYFKAGDALYVSDPDIEYGVVIEEHPTPVVKPGKGKPTAKPKRKGR